MGELVRLTSDHGGGAAVVSPAMAAHLRVVRSRAWYELVRGDRTEAARLAPALRDDLAGAITRCAEQLEAVPPDTITAKLTPLLALTAGSGMAGGARTEWLLAAADALKGVPADLLERGIRAARRQADHPSRIVPLVMDEILSAWRERLRDRGTVRQLLTLAGMNADEPPPVAADADRVDPAKVNELNAIMRRFGLTTRYAADGSAFTVRPDQTDAAPVAP